MGGLAFALSRASLPREPAGERQRGTWQQARNARGNERPETQGETPVFRLSFPLHGVGIRCRVICVVRDVRCGCVWTGGRLFFFQALRFISAGLQALSNRTLHTWKYISPTHDRGLRQF